jgi:hypothetical protein
MAMVISCGYFGVYLGLDLSLAMLFAGLVGTARLALSEHTPNHVYAGYVLGFAAQMGGFWFVLS